MAPRKGQLALAKNPTWKGGRTVASNGYVLIKQPDHPLADARGYVYEHRLVASEMLGRPLRPGELVHHRNGAKSDNRPENLEIVTRWQHGVEHRKPARKRGAYVLRRPDEPNPIVECACGCGGTLTAFDYQGRSRRFISGHNARKVAGQFG